MYEYLVLTTVLMYCCTAKDANISFAIILRSCGTMANYTCTAPVANCTSSPITHRTAPHQLLIAEARVYHPSWQIQRTWREARGAVATPTLPVDTSVHAPAPVPIPVRYGRWRAAQPHGCTTVASSSSVGARSADAGAPAVTREA